MIVQAVAGFGNKDKSSGAIERFDKLPVGIKTGGDRSKLLRKGLLIYRAVREFEEAPQKKATREWVAEFCELANKCVLPA